MSQMNRGKIREQHGRRFFELLESDSTVTHGIFDTITKYHSQRRGRLIPGGSSMVELTPLRPKNIGTPPLPIVGYKRHCPGERSY